MIRVLNVFDLMKAGRFERHQECEGLKYPDASSITILFSHRWETLKNPDPDGIQYHGAVRFAITACMMACGSTPNVFNEVDFSEIILCSRFSERLNDESRSLLAGLRTSASLKSFQADQDLLQKTGLLAKYLFETIGQENTLRVFRDLPLIAWLMRKLDFWYDFSCMPQEPRSQQEEEEFNFELGKLHKYFSDYTTCIHWSASSLKRAWCLLEGLISLKSDNQNVFCTENSLISSHKSAEIFEDQFGINVCGPSDRPLEVRELDQGIYQLYRRNQEPEDLSKDLTFRLQSDVREIAGELHGKNTKEILEFLGTNGYSTTREEDLKVVADSLARYFK